MTANGDKDPRAENNPEIAKAGASTQFGAPGGADPAAAGEKSGEARREATSVRNELRYLVAQDISNEGGNVEDELKRLRQTADGRTTIGRMLASRLLERAIKKAEPQMAATLLDNLEGKLSQEIVLPPTSRAPTDFGTLAEAEAAYKKHMPT